MRLFKLITVSLLLAIVALFIYQNLATFQTLINFSFDLYIREKLSWQHYLYTLLLFSFGIGFFGGILVMLRPYFNVRRRMIRERQERLDAKSSQPTAVAEPESSPQPELKDSSTSDTSVRNPS